MTMIRRRRRPPEIAFGFDSFLDVVANVVGIIIRMILVVWVGARAYTGLHFPPPKPRLSAEVESAVPPDSLEHELAQRRRELAQAQDRLLEQLRHLDQARHSRTQVVVELAGLAERKHSLEQEKFAVEGAERARQEQARTAAASLAEVQQRTRQLQEQIAALERQPSVKQALRYRAPVSQPLQTEELIFECRSGRVAFIDIDALLREVKRGMQDKGQLLRSRWEVSDVAGPVGPFRLRYTVERLRGTGLPVPDPASDFRYGVTAWEVEPMVLVRGEAPEAALAPGSEFRQIVDVLDPQQTAVTFCVYPDSFALYRRLRDYLYQRDVVVAGRPLPLGAAIASSRHGTISRGQ
jgi:hypothetical protein